MFGEHSVGSRLFESKERISGFHFVLIADGILKVRVLSPIKPRERISLDDPVAPVSLRFGKMAKQPKQRQR